MPDDIAAMQMAEVAAILAHPQGARGRMRDIEAEQGHTILQRDAPLAFAFSSEDWDADTLLTLNGKDVRIVLTNAVRPGSGAFGRLVRSIQTAGFNPVVISPVGPYMPVIMEKWGWREYVVGSGFRRCREWRPS